MKFVILAVCVALAAATTHHEAQALIDEHSVRLINTMNTTWRAEVNRFADYTLADGRRLCGTILDAESLAGLPVINKVSADIPTAFDSRTKWPGAIHPIRNQEQCGSCWAFAASEALSDRFAIQTDNKVDIVLSPQDLVSCDNKDGDMGCNGGYPIRAWTYMKETGIVVDACYPYTSGGGVTGTCKLEGSSCPSGTGDAKLYKAASAAAVSPTVEAIQTEIMTHGPIEVAFNVYQDFFQYKSGVYKHVSGGLAGGHAVKMIGWGEEGSTPYWWVANSWGADWGIDGFFKILRGVNECEIESQGVAGLADTSSL